MFAPGCCSLSCRLVSSIASSSASEKMLSYTACFKPVYGTPSAANFFLGIVRTHKKIDLGQEKKVSDQCGNMPIWRRMIQFPRCGGCGAFCFTDFFSVRRMNDVSLAWNERVAIELGCFFCSSTWTIACSRSSVWTNQFSFDVLLLSSRIGGHSSWLTSGMNIIVVKDETPLIHPLVSNLTCLILSCGNICPFACHFSAPKFGIN